MSWLVTEKVKQEAFDKSFVISRKSETICHWRKNGGITYKDSKLSHVIGYCEDYFINLFYNKLIFF